jgi:hypothetical protein
MATERLAQVYRSRPDRGSAPMSDAAERAEATLLATMASRSSMLALLVSAVAKPHEGAWVGPPEA